MTKFEKDIISAITPLMTNPSDKAEFTFGSLFIECGPNTISEIVTKLENLKQKIKCTKGKYEYVIDFVA